MHRYKGARLLSVACILYDCATGRWEAYSTLFKPEEGIPIDPVALQKNNLTLVCSGGALTIASTCFSRSAR